MKKLFKYCPLIFMAMAMVMVSCNKEESDNKPDISSAEAVRIVGKWILNTELCSFSDIETLEFDASGTVAVKCGKTYVGTWTYSKSAKGWLVEGTNAEGTYTMIGDNLYHPHNASSLGVIYDGEYIFSRENGSNPSDKASDDSRIYGTWKGECDGETFTMTFRNDGTLYDEYKEYFGDVYTDNSTYILKNGKMSFPDGEPFMSNAVLGRSPYTVEFSSANNPTWVKFTGPLDSFKMYKQ